MFPKTNTRDFGNTGENIACDFLRKNGYKILKRNFRSRFGEIDIIATKDGNLIFLEVKTRWSKKFGDPKEAVTVWKLQKIRKTAEFFCLINPSLPRNIRIEVVALDLTYGSQRKIEIIPVY